MVYRVPVEMLDTTDFLNMENHQLVCTHTAKFAIYIFYKRGDYAPLLILCDRELYVYLPIMHTGRSNSINGELIKTFALI